MTAMCFPRKSSTSGERCAIDLDVTIVTNFPRTGATPGEMCAMDVEFMPGMNFPRTISNPGEIGAVELGYTTVMGFSQIDSAPGVYGAVKLDFRRATFPPGESGVEDCDYIMPASLAGSSVCARTVTGSLIFGFPHRLVWSFSARQLSLFSGLMILIYPEGVRILRRIIILEQ